MVNDYLISNELDHFSKLLFGEKTNSHDTDELRKRLKDEFGIEVNVKSEGGWFGYKFFLVQVLRKDRNGEYINEHCTGGYGDNGEFPSKGLAMRYGLLVACTFALSINFKNGYLCLEN
jgi:hypothetical protein